MWALCEPHICLHLVIFVQQYVSAHAHTIYTKANSKALSPCQYYRIGWVVVILTYNHSTSFNESEKITHDWQNTAL